METHHLETATPRPVIRRVDVMINRISAIIRRVDWYKVAGLAITAFCAVAFYGGLYLLVKS